MNETKAVKLQNIVSTETTEIANAPEKDKNAQAHKLLKEHLPVITCDCGAEILLVPDISETEISLMREETCAFFRRASDN
jgi:hypothetical protein